MKLLHKVHSSFNGFINLLQRKIFFCFHESSISFPRRNSFLKKTVTNSQTQNKVLVFMDTKAFNTFFLRKLVNTLSTYSLGYNQEKTKTSLKLVIFREINIIGVDHTYFQYEFVFFPNISLSSENDNLDVTFTAKPHPRECY